MQYDDRFDKVRAAAEWLKRNTSNFKPAVGIIAGSGLAAALPVLENAITIPYFQIPGFPATTVKGHKGELVFGTHKGVKVVMMRGRFHYYEGHSMALIALPIRVLWALGIRSLIVTAAVGSLKPTIKPGDLVILKDQVNMMGSNPLIGNHHEAFGEMFPDMAGAYDAKLRAFAVKAAGKLKAKTHQGVYLAVSGPSYETPTEIKLFRAGGGDVVGMSVVPEVITARQLKLKVLGVCWISNFGCGISKQVLDHADVLKLGEKVSVKMRALLEKTLESGLL